MRKKILLSKYIAFETVCMVEFAYFSEDEIKNIPEDSFLHSVFFGGFKEQQQQTFLWHRPVSELAFYKTYLKHRDREDAVAKVYDCCELKQLMTEIDCAHFLCDAPYQAYLARSIMATCQHQADLHSAKNSYPPEFVEKFPHLLWTLNLLSRSTFKENYTDLFFMMPNLSSLNLDIASLTRLDFSDVTPDLSGMGTQAFLRCCKEYNIPLDNDDFCESDAMAVFLRQVDSVRIVTVSPLQRSLNLADWPWDTLADVTQLHLTGQFSHNYSLAELITYFAHIPKIQSLHLGGDYSLDYPLGEGAQERYQIPELTHLVSFGASGDSRLGVCHLFLNQNATVSTVDLVTFDGDSLESDIALVENPPIFPQVKTLSINGMKLNVLDRLLDETFSEVTHLSLVSGVLAGSVFFDVDINLNGITHLNLNVRRLNPIAFSRCLISSFQTLSVLNVFSGQGAEPLLLSCLNELQELPQLIQLEAGSYQDGGTFLVPEIVTYLKSLSPHFDN